MRDLLAGVCAVLLLGVSAWAQSSGSSTTSSSLADNQPSENVRSGAVYNRAPGRIVDAAISRHSTLAAERLAAQRSANTALLAPQESTTSGSSGSSSSASGLGGSISSLLSTFLNSGLGTGLSGGQTVSGSGTSGTNFSNLPPEVLQMLANAGISLGDLKNATQKTQNDSTSTTADSKASTRMQSTTQTTTETKFVVRWLDAMLSTTFTAVTLAVQNSTFINLLKDAFRPLFGLPTSTTTQSTAKTSTARVQVNGDPYSVGSVGNRAPPQ